MTNLKTKKYTVLSGAMMTALSSYYASAQVAGPYGPTPFSNTSGGGYTGSTSNILTGGPNSVSTGGIEVGTTNYYTGATTPSTLAANRYSTGYILTSAGTVNLAPAPGASTAAGGSGPNSARSINTTGNLIAGLSNSYTYVNATNTTVTGSSVTGVWTSGNTYVPLPVAKTDASATARITVPRLSTMAGPSSEAAPSTTATTLEPRSGRALLCGTNSGTATAPIYASYSELLAPQNSTGSIASGSRSENAFGISDKGLAVGSGLAVQRLHFRGHGRSHLGYDQHADDDGRRDPDDDRRRDTEQSCAAGQQYDVRPGHLHLQQCLGLWNGNRRRYYNQQRGHICQRIECDRRLGECLQ